MGLPVPEVWFLHTFYGILIKCSAVYTFLAAFCHRTAPRLVRGLACVVYRVGIFYDLIREYNG